MSPPAARATIAKERRSKSKAEADGPRSAAIQPHPETDGTDRPDHALTLENVNKNNEKNMEKDKSEIGRREGCREGKSSEGESDDSQTLFPDSGSGSRSHFGGSGSGGSGARASSSPSESLEAADDKPSSGSQGSQGKADGESDDSGDLGSGSRAGGNSGGVTTSSRSDSPVDANKLPSVGSVGHPTECKPCTFFCFSSGGCVREEQCPFCHFAHTSKHQEKRAAWKEQRRERKNSSKKAKEKAAEQASNTSSGEQGPKTPPKLELVSETESNKSVKSVKKIEVVTESPFGSPNPLDVDPLMVPLPCLRDKPLDRCGFPNGSVEPLDARAPLKVPLSMSEYEQRQCNGGPMHFADCPRPIQPPSGWSAPDIGGQFAINSQVPAPVSPTPSSFHSKESVKAKSNADFFAENVARFSIHGNPVSICVGNPYLPDCPLVGLSDGFTEMTGYDKEEILGKNCRILSQGCHVDIKPRSRMRYAIATGCECQVVVENKRKDGTRFANVVFMSGIKVGDRTYIIAIQVNDMTGSNESISRNLQQKEFQALIDRIFGLHIESWAEKQIQSFSARVAPPFDPFRSVSFTEGIPHTEHHRPHQVRMPSRNTFLDMEPPRDGRFSTQSLQANPPGIRDGLSFPPEISGHAQPFGNSSISFGDFCYQPSATLVATGQRVDLLPNNADDLIGQCIFSVVPPLPPGLHINPQSGAITGVAMKDGPAPSKWVEYQVFAALGVTMYYTKIQIKVIDLVNDLIVEQLCELSTGQYMGTFYHAHPSFPSRS